MFNFSYILLLTRKPFSGRPTVHMRIDAQAAHICKWAVSSRSVFQPEEGWVVRGRRWVFAWGGVPSHDTMELMDRHDWKQYLPATTYAGGNNEISLHTDTVKLCIFSCRLRRRIPSCLGKRWPGSSWRVRTVRNVCTSPWTKTTTTTTKPKPVSIKNSVPTAAKTATTKHKQQRIPHCYTTGRCISILQQQTPALLTTVYLSQPHISIIWGPKVNLLIQICLSSATTRT